MISKYTNGSVTWIDIFEPTTEDVHVLMDEYNINPETAHELQLPTYKEKIVTYKDYIYLSLHFPALRHTHIDKTDQEIDFIVGKDFIITTRYEPIDALERFVKTFEFDSVLKKGLMDGHAGYVFYHMLTDLYKSMADEADSINDTLEAIDKDIFAYKEKEMVGKISVVSRDLVSFYHIMITHKDILLSLKDVSVKSFGKDFAKNISKILNEYFRIEKTLVHNIEFVKELRYTNDALLSLKQNEVMKNLTILSFITFPLTLMTGIFAMETKYKPIVGMDNDFFIIVGIMLATVTLFFLFFKFKKWL